MMLPTKGEIEREIARRAAVASILETSKEDELSEKDEIVVAGGDGGEAEFVGEWHEEKTHRVKRLSEEFGDAVPEGVL